MQIPWSMVHYRNADSYLQDSAERPCRAEPGGMDSLFLDRCIWLVVSWWWWCWLALISAVV